MKNTHIYIILLILMCSSCKNIENRISVIQSETKLTDKVGHIIPETPWYPSIYNDSFLVFLNNISGVFVYNANNGDFIKYIEPELNIDSILDVFNIKM